MIAAEATTLIEELDAMNPGDEVTVKVEDAPGKLIRGLEEARPHAFDCVITVTPSGDTQMRIVKHSPRSPSAPRAFAHADSLS